MSSQKMRTTLGGDAACAATEQKRMSRKQNMLFRSMAVSAMSRDRDMAETAMLQNGGKRFYAASSASSGGGGMMSDLASPLLFSPSSSTSLAGTSAVFLHLG